VKRLILLIILFIFIGCPLLRAEEITLTLDEAVAIALRGNRDILLKSEEVKRAKLKISEAQANLYPSLTFTGVWKDTRDFYPKPDLGQTTTQFTLKQYLYRGGKTINTIAQQENKWEVTQALLDKSKLDTILTVQKAFYLFLLTKDISDLNKKILENTLEHLTMVSKRYRKGQVSESEVLRIKESLANVKKAYSASLNQAEVSEALLKNLLFLEETIKINPVGFFVYQPKEVVYDEAFLKAMKNRPEIRQYEAQERADKKAIEIVKADNRPSIYASWDYYSSSTTTATFTSSKAWQDYSIIGFTFTWPIFDGWATKSKVEQAIVDLKETQLTQEKVKRDITLELKNAYLSLGDAIAKMRAVESEVLLYEDNFTTAQGQYKKGIASSLDLHDADLKRQVALFNRNQAIYDYLIARVSFDKSTGGL